jgi:hypothetical protein
MGLDVELEHGSRSPATKRAVSSVATSPAASTTRRKPSRPPVPSPG